MNLPHLSTSTPASEISSADFRDDGSTGEELATASLDDILRNSPAAELLGLGSLPEEDGEVLTPEDSAAEQEEVPETAEDADKDASESDQETDSEDTEGKDDTSTQAGELPSEDDIDWEYKVPVIVDGKQEYVTLEEIRKGYATDKHLSQKGREIGELKKQVEQERTEKLNALVELGTVLNAELSSEEVNLATEYHSLKEQIQKARDEGDSYTARELKDKLESAQENYWKVRNKRESTLKQVAEQIKVKQQEEQQRLMEHFTNDIKDKVPEFNEKVATSIREFALAEGIPESLLNVIYDANVVKFINDYRKLKEATSTGAAKRKQAPVSKSIPTKKGTPQNVKQAAQAKSLQQKVLSGAGSDRDGLEFLKSISSVSRKL